MTARDAAIQGDSRTACRRAVGIGGRDAIAMRPTASGAGELRVSAGSYPAVTLCSGCGSDRRNGGLRRRAMAAPRSEPWPIMSYCDVQFAICMFTRHRAVSGGWIWRASR